MWFVVASAVALAACGTEEAPVSATPSAEPDQVYTGTFTVLQSPGHGPQLCSMVEQSFPPHCGGPDVVGWSWDEAEGAESANGTTWGHYVVTGTWDGQALTLTQPPMPTTSTTPVPPPDGPDFTSPCEPPAGGWAVVEPAKATDVAMTAAMEHAATEPDYAGAWIDQSINPASDDPEPDEFAMNDPTKLILNIRFTGDLDRHEQELRKIWGGALCVSRAERTELELRDIQDELTGTPNISSSGVDVVTGTVVMDVFIDGGLQAEMDERYGAGLVRVVAALQPVE